MSYHADKTCFRPDFMSGGGGDGGGVGGEKIFFYFFFILTLNQKVKKRKVAT